MIVVGIDTGLVNTGVAVIEEGVARTRCTINVEGDSVDTGPRYVKLREGLELVARRVLKGLAPAVVAIEQPEQGLRVRKWKGKRYETDPASIMKLYGAFAVTYAESARLWPRAHLVGVEPTAWKGNYPKHLTVGMMRAKYKVECDSPDAWDALGLADYAWDIAVARKRGEERARENRCVEH